MSRVSALLKEKGMLKRAFDYKDFPISCDRTYPMVWSQEMLDCIKEISDGATSVSRSILINFLDNIVTLARRDTGTTVSNVEYLHKNIIVNMVANLIGKKQAEEYVEFMYEIFTDIADDGVSSRQIITTLVMLLFTVNDQTTDNRNKNMLDIKELCLLLFIFVLQFYDKDDIEKIIANPQMHITDTMKNVCNTYGDLVNDADNLKYITLIPSGRLLHLPLETKQDIVSSIWNSIIYIISKSSINTVEDYEEGGEE